jgi:hypothetical protein
MEPTEAPVDVPEGHVSYRNKIPPERRRLQYDGDKVQTMFWLFSPTLDDYKPEQHDLWVGIDMQKMGWGNVMMDKFFYNARKGTYSMQIVGTALKGIDMIILSPMGQLSSQLHMDGRRCEMQGCGRSVKIDNTTLSRCSRCKKVYYCCEAHQRADWSARHKKQCHTIEMAVKSEQTPLGLPPNMAADAISIDLINSRLSKHLQTIGTSFAAEPAEEEHKPMES